MGNTRSPSSEPADTSELVRDNIGLVQHVVNQLAARYPRHVDRHELWSAGALGLVDAARRYDPDTGIPFARYASIRIRGAIIDANRERDWAPRSLRRHARAMETAADQLAAANGRQPSTAEVAAALKISVREFRARQAGLAQARILDLDRPADEDPGVTLADALWEQHDDFLPERALENQEILGALRVAVTLLPPGHREIVERYYFHGHLLRDIAADRGVTEARVSQLCLEAVQAIRAYFATIFDDVPAVAERAPGRARREAYVASATKRVTWRDRLVAGGA